MFLLFYAACIGREYLDLSFSVADFHKYENTTYQGNFMNIKYEKVYEKFLISIVIFYDFIGCSLSIESR